MEAAAFGARVVTVTADLATESGCVEAVAAAAEAFGGVDVLVNCAGAARMGSVLTLPVEVIDEALQLKLYGYLRMAQLVAPHMQTAGWGRIVNIAGGAGTSPTPRAEVSPPSMCVGGADPGPLLAKLPPPSTSPLAPGTSASVPAVRAHAIAAAARLPACPLI